MNAKISSKLTTRCRVCCKHASFVIFRNEEQKFTIGQILTEAESFLASKLSLATATTDGKLKGSTKVSKYEGASGEHHVPDDRSSNDEIALKILEQIEALKKENMKLQSITEKDLLLLDETDTLVEGNLMNMKQHNARVAQFASRAWKRTGLYWTIIFFSILAFFAAFMIIKIFPRPF